MGLVNVLQLVCLSGAAVDDDWSTREKPWTDYFNDRDGTDAHSVADCSMLSTFHVTSSGGRADVRIVASRRLLLRDEKRNRHWSWRWTAASFQFDAPSPLRLAAHVVAFRCSGRNGNRLPDSPPFRCIGFVCYPFVVCLCLLTVVCFSDGESPGWPMGRQINRGHRQGIRTRRKRAPNWSTIHSLPLPPSWDTTAQKTRPIETNIV